MGSSRKVREKRSETEKLEREEESEKLGAKKEKILGLIELRKKRLNVEKGEEALSESDREFQMKEVFLPAFTKWTEEREAEGKDVSFVDFIKEEDLSNLEFDIVLAQLEKYEEENESVPMGRDAMLEKRRVR